MYDPELYPGAAPCGVHPCMTCEHPNESVGKLTARQPRNHMDGVWYLWRGRGIALLRICLSIALLRICLPVGCSSHIPKQIVSCSALLHHRAIVHHAIVHHGIHMAVAIR